MKQCIHCRSCVCGQDGDFRVYGAALRDYRCDWCNCLLPRGEIVVAVSYWRGDETQAEKDYHYNWENEFVSRVGLYDDEKT